MVVAALIRKVFQGNSYFQQDGALPHFHVAVRDFLGENLLEVWIG
jgi:hypothetical protein